MVSYKEHPRTLSEDSPVPPFVLPAVLPDLIRKYIRPDRKLMLVVPLGTTAFA